MSNTNESPLTRLDAIIQNGRLEKDDKLNAILQLGLDVFMLDMGIISKIENQRYYVMHSLPENPAMKPGTIFDFDTTYCNITVNFPIPVAIAHARISEHHRHPCRELFNLEAYIGTKFKYSSYHNGTVNFSGMHPRMPFSRMERELIEKMGYAVEKLMQ